MAIANCKRCGRIFNRVRRDICASCIEQEDQLFLVVRDYLRANPDAFMDEVIKETGVAMEMLIEMIKDGRIILADNPNINYPCERCGRPTQRGRLCVACAKDMVNSLSEASKSLREKVDKPSNRDRGYHSR